MELTQPSDVKALLQDLADLVGIDPAGFAMALKIRGAGEPRPIKSVTDVAGLVRDILVNTVGMGIDLP
jgi:hypothetical protein